MQLPADNLLRYGLAHVLVPEWRKALQAAEGALGWWAPDTLLRCACRATGGGARERRILRHA